MERKLTLRTDEGWLYLAVVIDLWSRAVIGWSMSPRMTAQPACDALQMALWRRKRPENVIVHTDRGGQYCSADYQALLKRHNLRGSMSAKGCCYDNACAESFFHSLKVECIHGERFISRKLMRTAVFNYMECDYNHISYSFSVLPSKKGGGYYLLVSKKCTTLVITFVVHA